MDEFAAYSICALRYSTNDLRCHSHVVCISHPILPNLVSRVLSLLLSRVRERTLGTRLQLMKQADDVSKCVTLLGLQQSNLVTRVSSLPPLVVVPTSND